MMLRFRWDSLRRIDRCIADDAPDADVEVLPVASPEIERHGSADCRRWTDDAAAA